MATIKYWPVTAAGVWTGGPALELDERDQVPSVGYRPGPQLTAQAGKVAVYAQNGNWTFVPTADAPVHIPADPHQDDRSPREKGWRMEEVWRNRLFTSDQLQRLMDVQELVGIRAQLRAKRAIGGELTTEETALADSPQHQLFAQLFREDQAAKLTELGLDLWRDAVLAFALAGVFGTDPAVTAAEVERVTAGYFPSGSPWLAEPESRRYVMG